MATGDPKLASNAPNAPVLSGADVELSVIVPCLNEELNIPELAARILRVFEAGQVRGELVIIDDGSTDGTAAVIRDLMRKHEGVVGCFHPENRGIAAAWKSGAAAARGTLVAILDADLQYQPEDLLRLRRELYDHSVDIVQGWRSAVGRRKDRRYTLSRGFNVLLNAAFGMRLRDNKSGFLMCSREVFLDLLTYKGSYFYWQSFVMVAAHAKGYSYKEIETIFEQRRQGVSFLDKTAQVAALKSFVDLGKAAWEYRVKRPPADVAAQLLRRYPVVDRSPERDPLATLRWRAYLAGYNRTHFMLTRGVEHHYETLRKTQWLGAAHTRELQDEKLRRLVRHCYRNVPYYRAQMQAIGLRPEDIRGQEDLPRLPVLTRDDVRRHLYFDIMSEDHDKSDVLPVTTSGAGGEPFTCYADRSALEFRWAATQRAQEWTGYRFGDPSVRLWQPPVEMTARREARERLDALLANRTQIAALTLSDKEVAEMLATIRGAQPVLVEGHAEVLDFLAHAIKTTGPLGARPRAILSHAQTLPQSSRRLIEEAFGGKVFDAYVTGEFAMVAQECDARDGHHVVAEGYIVEILKDGRPARPGELGEVVITDLNNYCMPFVRYRIGDLAEAMDPSAACSCGRGSPRIGAIDGRPQSIIQGTHGRHVPGALFAHYLKDFDYAIKRFQVVQSERGAIQLRIVKGGRFSRQVLDEVLTTLRRYLGDDMRIDVEIAEDIPAADAGDPSSDTSRPGSDVRRAAPAVLRAGEN